jgi:5-methylcytosine-specific restriction endonuclease McrBC regulatory subunit McrC
MWYMLSAGDANTFVFLLNMNKVFEDYVKAVLEAFSMSH